MRMLPPADIWPLVKRDFLYAVVLAMLTSLLWCAHYDRWSAKSWQTPLTYLADPAKGDIISLFAGIKAERDGRIGFFQFSNVPELGAPYVANWDDNPCTEKPVLKLMGLLARIFGIFAALNLTFLLGHVLAALSFYSACRLLNGSRIWAFTGALIFAFARFVFAQGAHHITVSYYWHIPLCLVVCEWIFRRQGLRLGEWRLNFAVIVAFVTGVQNVYYTNLFDEFVLMGALVQGFRYGWRRFLPAGLIVSTSAVAFLLMNLNTFLYSLLHGANALAVVRSYQWLEIYGLKLVDLVIPPPDHPFPPFAAWGAGHLKEIILSGEIPPGCYLGLTGLAALGWLVAASFRRVLNRTVLPLEAFFILWIIIYGNVGGLNGIMGTLGFVLFRTTARYSIFILAIVLIYAVRRLSIIPLKNKVNVPLLAGLIMVIAIWDQSPPRVTAGELAGIDGEVSSDRSFTEKMEARLSPNAMVFQLPLMEFPEAPVAGVGAYDHFRPYLYSHHLRFSFGGEKGRPSDEWQKEFSHLRTGEATERLESYGFSAIYINRNGFQDHGEALIKDFQAIGRGEMIESEDGNLVCIFLNPSADPITPYPF